MPVVAAAQAVVYPGAVVVGFRHTPHTQAAVFAPCGFGEVASTAGGVWVEEEVVVGVVAEPRRHVRMINKVSLVCDGEVGEVERQGD